MNLSKIAICIPCYNQPDLLCQCLRSIRQQTYADFQIIIIDDSSRSDYQPVLHEFSDLPIHYERNEANLGAMHNMLKAVRYESKSEFILAFHEDDLLHPDFLKYSLSVLEQDSKVAFVGTNQNPFKEEKEIVNKAIADTFSYRIYLSAIDFVTELLNGVAFTFGSVVYRRKYLEEHVFDLDAFSTLCDRPFLCDIAQGNHCAFINEPLVNYRSHGDKDQRGINLNENHLINLFTFYKHILPSPMPALTRNTFYRNATNNLLDSYTRLSAANRSNIFAFISKCRKNGVISFKHLDRKGIRALLKMREF